MGTMLDMRNDEPQALPLTREQIVEVEEWARGRDWYSPANEKLVDHLVPLWDANTTLTKELELVRTLRATESKAFEKQAELLKQKDVEIKRLQHIIDNPVPVAATPVHLTVPTASPAPAPPVNLGKTLVKGRRGRPGKKDTNNGGQPE